MASTCFTNTTPKDAIPYTYVMAYTHQKKEPIRIESALF
jgi:hypothetical protein